MLFGGFPTVKVKQVNLTSSFGKASACMLAFASLTNLVPNSDTIYLMAGAKGAEVAVESEVGKEILGDIQEVIKFQLEKLKAEG